MSSAAIVIGTYGIANFILSFLTHSDKLLVLPYRNNLANHKTSQQCDLYLNKHCRYPVLTSENVRVYVSFGYIMNFHRQID